MTDKELFEQAPEDEEQVLDIKQDERRVYADKKDPLLYGLYTQWKDGDLNLQPDFQRREVWDDKKGGRLIESLVTEIPIPLIYLSEEKDGKWTVIDGQQRLKWLFDYLDNTYSLKGLRLFPELNGKEFADLDKTLQRKIKNSTIRVIEISNRSHPDVKFEIFERINTGSVPLNAQELRNCIYRGPYNAFIKYLSANIEFLSLLGMKKPHDRMMDCEYILRFFAFVHTNYQQYTGNMRRFLNDEMERWKKIEEKEMKKLQEVFSKSVGLIKSVFGDKAFHRFQLGDENDPNGKWEQRVNKALFDIKMYGFSLYEKRDIVPHADALREELIWFMSHDEDFIWSIAKSTDSKRSVQIHFDKWLAALRELIGYPIKEPRAYSHSLKEELWKQNPLCAYEKCGQKIMLIDDAEIDHIEHYWRGGQTIPSNARLVHRYCNRARGGRN